MHKHRQISKNRKTDLTNLAKNETVMAPNAQKDRMQQCKTFIDQVRVYLDSIFLFFQIERRFIWKNLFKFIFFRLKKVIFVLLFG